MHYLKLITAVSTNSFLHKYSFYISIIHLLCPEFTGLIAKKRLEVKNLGSQLSVRLLLLWRRWWWWGFTHTTAAAVVAPAFSFNITPLDSLSQMNVLIFQLSVSLHTNTLLPQSNYLPHGLPKKPNQVIGLFPLLLLLETVPVRFIICKFEGTFFRTIISLFHNH